MSTVNNPFPYFPDAGTNGYIYIGSANQDAQTNPITVYRDEALTIPWAQPIRTVDGYPAYQGAASGIFIASGSYSIKVQDKNRVTRVNELLASDPVAAFAASLAAASGSSLVGFTQSGTGAATRTVQAKLRETVSLDDYILSTDPVVSGFPDASNAFVRASAVSSLILGRPGAVYYVKDVDLDGRIFDGRGCVLRDAPGAKFGIALKGYRPELRNITFQDQGSYVASTTLASGALSGATSITVSSAAGIAVGDVIFVEIDANEIRWQTFVSSVSGTLIGLRDPLPAASAGKPVDAMVSAIRVGAATHWAIEDVQVVNARGALLTMPPTGQEANKGTINRFDVNGSRYFGWIKAGDCAGVKAYDVKLWNGYVETTTVAGNGTAGPFSFGKRVFLLRDVTVTVNGVAQVYGTDWNYASQTSIQFLAGRFPAVGATIIISHFRDGFRGFVEDQRSTAIISGGNVYDTIESLDAFIGASFFESELTEVRSLIADTCQYVGLQLSACPNTLVFTNDTFLGYNGVSLKLFGSNPKAFLSLYTHRVPLSDQWLGSLDDNIYSDATSDLRIGAVGWSGEFQNTVAAGGKFAIVGGSEFAGRNIANVAGGSTVYLANYGHSANLADTVFRAPRDGTLKAFRVDTDVAPGAGQTYTYDVLVAGVSQGTVTISGASAFSGTGILNTFVAQGAQINLRLITSATAAASARHYMQAVMI